MAHDLKDDIRDIAYYLKKKLKELEIKNYYSKTPSKINDYISKIIDNVLGYIDDTNIDEISLKRIGLFLSYMNIQLEYLDHADINEIPIELVELFEDILKKYDENSSVYLIGCYSLNYFYLDVLGYLKSILENSNIPHPPSPDKKIGVIAFPISQRDNLLMNSILAHEMGHFLDDILKIKEQITIQTDSNLIEELVEEFFEGASEIKVEGQDTITLDKFFRKEFFKANITEELNKIMNRWVQEYIADTAGIYLFGPAYFFAFVCLSDSLFDEYIYSADHPPLFLRMIPVINTLEELGYIKLLNKYPNINKKIEKYSDMKKKHLPSSDKKGKILEDASKKIFNIIKQKVKEKIKPYITKTKFKNEVDLLREKVKNFIPPNEILNYDNTTKPSHPLSIINVGWISRIEDISEIYNLYGADSEKEKNDVRYQLNKHLLKALESRSIHEKILKGIDKDA